MTGSYKYRGRRLRLSGTGLSVLSTPKNTYRRKTLCLIASCGGSANYEEIYFVLRTQLERAPRSLGCRSKGYEDDAGHDATKWINGLIYGGFLEVAA